MIQVKRLYEKAEAADGTRFLVDRLWPRGISKASLPVTAWVKDAAPSTVLRQWFRHDAPKWEEFLERYFAELDANPDAWAPLLEAAKSGPVTLVYSSQDAEHNNAIALAQYLRTKLPQRNKRGAKSVR